MPFTFQNQDKLYHFIAGVLISAIVYFFIPQLSLPITAIVAVAKEFYDYKNQKNHTPDWNDALFTILGGVCFLVQMIVLKIA